MKKSIALSIAGAVLLTGGIAVAQAGHGGMPMGDMTRADAQTHSTQMFQRMDANKDGKLDEADRAAHRKQRFDSLDKDSNGSLSFEEFSARDGGKRGMMAHDGQHGGGAGMRQGGKSGHGMMAKMADTNKDGAVSQAEFTAAALSHFDHADTNKDGKVTAEERKAMHASMRAMRQPAQ